MKNSKSYPRKIKPTIKITSAEFVYLAASHYNGVQKHANCHALPKNKKQNYLLRKNNIYFVVIRDDKVIQSHRSAQFELSDELNNVIDERLICET